MCMRAAKDWTQLCGCADSSEPLQIADAINARNLLYWFILKSSRCQFIELKESEETSNI